MKYVAQSKLKKLREEMKGEFCPITGSGLDDCVVDHDHDTGEVRGVISRGANTFEGKIYKSFKRYCGGANVSLPTALRCLADYLESTEREFLHPVGAKQLISRFRRADRREQVSRLHGLGATLESVAEAKTSAGRTLLYEKLLKKDRY